MNSKLHLALIILISITIFGSGIYFAVQGINLTLCKDYALAGEVTLEECSSIANWMWASLGVGIISVITLILVTKGGWKKNESQ